MDAAITISEKQAEYIREAHHRWNFAIGAVRSGKSHIAVQYVIPFELRRLHGKKGLNFIIGATKENIERNVLQPIRDIWGDGAATQINARGIAKIFGEKVYCIGGEAKDQVSRLRGTEIKFVYIDEATDIHKEVFEMLKSRLSLPYSICHAAANPSYPTHYIKEFLDTVAKGVDIYCQTYTLYDNPFLPPNYVKALEAEYAGTVYFLRYVLGKWAKAEGLIWPMYDKCIEYVEGKPTEYVISMDYGTMNPFAAMLWGKINNIWYGMRCYYYDGRNTGRQKTDDDYANDIDDWISDILEERIVESMKKGIEPKKIEVIIDPSAKSFITLMKRKKWCKVKPAKNDVLEGIRQTATCMQRGLIKISPEVKEWKDEASGYAWDESNPDVEQPIKEKDHLCDAVRYFCVTKKILKPKTEYHPLWN